MLVIPAGISETNAYTGFPVMIPVPVCVPVKKQTHKDTDNFTVVCISIC
jgi:hypothetical protein